MKKSEIKLKGQHFLDNLACHVKDFDPNNRLDKYFKDDYKFINLFVKVYTAPLKTLKTLYHLTGDNTNEEEDRTILAGTIVKCFQTNAATYFNSEKLIKKMFSAFGSAVECPDAIMITQLFFRYFVPTVLNLLFIICCIIYDGSTLLLTITAAVYIGINLKFAEGLSEFKRCIVDEKIFPVMLSVTKARREMEDCSFIVQCKAKLGLDFKKAKIYNNHEFRALYRKQLAESA